MTIVGDDFIAYQVKWQHFQIVPSIFKVYLFVPSTSREINFLEHLISHIKIGV
jgi:hypothetical protein